MKSLYLFLFTFLFCSISTYAQTFDFEDATWNTGSIPYTVTQTKSGVLLTVTTTADPNDHVELADGGGILGTTVNIAYCQWISATQMILTFDTPVNVISMQAGDVNNNNYTWVFDPDVGTTQNIAVASGGTNVNFGGSFTGVSTITITRQGGGTINPVVDNIVCSAANTTPSISIDNAVLAYTENAAVTQIDATGTLTDADGDADWNNGKLEVQITANNEAADEISIPDNIVGSINTSTTNLQNGGTVIGTLSASEGTVTNGTKLTITFNANATNALVQQVLRAIHYRNTSDNPGTNNRTITFTATDKNSGTNNDTRTVSVAAVNDDPTLTGKPTDITVTEDVASNVDLSSVTFADVDAGSGTVTFTIVAGTGTLTASSGGSVTVSGSGTVTLTLSGTVSNIDTYLNTASNIKYTSASNANGNDVATLTLSANDGGNTGSGGGGNVSFGTVNVDITAVNDDPAITGLPTDITVVEETASDVDLSAATLSDVDAGASNITLTIATGAGTLSATSGGSVTIGGSGTGTLTLTGTVSNIDTYLNTASNIKYTGALNASGNNATTLTLTANDGGATGSGGGGNVSLGSVNVDITGVNDDPTITGLPTDITVIEDVASNVDLSTATFSDADAGANSVTLTIAVGAGTLSVAASAGLTFTGNATGTITITGTATNIDTYLNTPSNILYTSASNANGNDVTTLTLTANDGGFTGTGGGTDVSLGTVNVDITAVNDPPVVGNVFGDNTSEVIAGSGAQNITDLDDAAVSNADSPDYNGGFLTITQGSGTANGSFGVDGTTVTSGGDATIAAGETISVGGNSIGTLHATNDGQGGNPLQIDFNSANATSARIETLIRSLTYSAPSGLGARVFTLTLNDADGTTNGGDQDASGNFTITVTPNPPVLGNIDGDNSSIPVGGAAGNIDAGGNATVTDADSPNFNTGFISIVQNTGTANGNFSVDGTTVTSGGDAVIASGETITVSGTSVGTVHVTNTGQSGNNLEITFNSNATPARVQTLLRNLKYAAPTGPGSRTFTVSVKDANSGGATGTANITITVNPPEMDLKQGTTAIADEGSYNYGNKAINSNNDVVFTIHNTATGVLSIATPLSLGGADAGQFSIQAQPSATVAANDSTTFTVRFTPTSTGAKTATIAITNGDTDENPYNITLNGSGNSVPTGDDGTITMNGNATYTFSASDFTFNDPDTDPFGGIQVQSLETAGTLTYNGIDAVTLVDYTDITKLKFVPASNQSGSPYATFTFKVIDNNGGHSAASYTMTINVTAAPQAKSPVVTVNTGCTLTEGGSIVLTGTMLSSNDEDSNVNLLTYVITQEPENGSLTNTTFTQSDISNGLITYTHYGSETLVDSFKFVVKDNDGNSSTESTFIITIEGVNDPPQFNGTPNFVMNEDEVLTISKASLLDFVVDIDTPDSILVVTLSSNSEEMNITATDSSFILLGQENWSGIAKCTFSVSDGVATIDTLIDVTVKDVNDSPQFTGIPNIKMNEDEEFAISKATLLGFVVDTDTPNNTLAVSLSSITNELITTASDGSFILLGQKNWYGTAKCTFSISDGVTTVDTLIDITVQSVNDIPVITGLPQNIEFVQKDNAVIELNGTVTDTETPDSLLTYSFSADPDSIVATYDNKTGIVTVTGVGNFVGDAVLTITVTDTDGGSADAVVNVKVMPDATTGIAQLEGIPEEYTLFQNYPNPFNPATKIRFGLPQESNVKLVVYNILGQEVAVLNNSLQSAGYYEMEWNASNVSSGIYIYRLSAKSTSGEYNFIKINKMILMK